MATNPRERSGGGEAEGTQRHARGRGGGADEVAVGGGEPAPTYVERSGWFTVEVIHGGFFFGSGNNRCYLDGQKVCYDYCHVERAYSRFFEELVEQLGYEKAGRIDMYWLPHGSQINEGAARLLCNDADIDAMYLMINRGHHFQMIYLDHVDSHISGGAEWDDVVANPVAQIPVVFSPKKMPSRYGNESNTSCSVVDESQDIQSHDQLFVKLRPRGQKIEEEEEPNADSDSDSDSNYFWDY